MKIIRKLSLLALGAASIATLAGCNQNNDKPASGLKVGLILLHPAASSTYDANFKEAFDAAREKLGFQGIVRENVPEGDECQQVAELLADQGCDIVFADSFGHEDYMIEAAKSHPNTMFCHATGVKAALSTSPANFYNAFASIYEGRYLAGIAAGMKLQQLYGDAQGNVSNDNAKMGYVGAFTYAEVMSGYTSFFLGAKSVVPNVTMDVTFTGEWYHETKEKTAAELLLSRHVKLISQHADSYGAPNACEQAGIPNVSYNGSTLEHCPNTFLVSSKINWAPYFEHIVDCKLNNKTLEKDYVGTIQNGSVELTALSNNCAPGTAEKIAQAKAKLENGTLHVFDTSTFTIGGAAPTEANVRPGAATWANVPNQAFLAGGYYHESEYRSAPSFDVEIDGITLLDRQYGGD